MRVTDNMRFNNTTNNLFKVQSEYNELLTKMASQKRINKISDDPTGIGKVFDYRHIISVLDQNVKNIDASNSWQSITESKLRSASDLLIRARELAVGQATATASPESRRIAANSVEQLIDEMRGLANTNYNNRYIFAGSRTDVAPFSAARTSPAISPVMLGQDNQFDGTVTATGPYTGQRNNTYVLKITAGGLLAAAQYQISLDGGLTWGGTQTGLTGPVLLGNGVSLNFAAGTADLAENDVFYVHATASGYYHGNGGQLKSTIAQGTQAVYNISGEEVFTDHQGGIDIFQVLVDFKNALEGNNVAGIKSAIGSIREAEGQIQRNISIVGTRIFRLEMAKSNLEFLKDKTIEIMSSIEDADFAALATEFAMQEVALKASYTIAGRIRENSILDFLR